MEQSTSRIPQAEERRGNFVQLAVYNLAVRHDEETGLERSDALFNLAWQPDVILVAQENVISTRRSNCTLEIPDNTQAPPRRDNPDSRIIDGIHDGNGPIRRAVIGNHHLVLMRQLCQDRAQLRLDIGTTVVCGQADGDHEWIGPCQRFLSTWRIRKR